MNILYGIKSCDTVKKARQWLEANGREYRFHDFRADGLTAAMLERFEQCVGWETLLNRRGTTWRQLDESRRADLDRGRALELMLEFPAVIKRPVLDTGGAILVGFSADDYSARL